MTPGDICLTSHKNLCYILYVTVFITVMPKNNRRAIKTTTFRLNMNLKQLSVFNAAIAKLSCTKTDLITYALNRVIERNKGLIES
jgi:hypothetical protein